VPIFFADFKNYLEAASGGRIQVSLFGSEELMPDAELHHAVAEGTLDISMSCGSYVDDMIDIGHIEFGMPRSWENLDDMLIIWESMGLLDLVSEEYAENNIHYLTVAYDCPYTMISAKPIDTLDKIRKLKVRTVGGTATFFEKLGVQTVYVPGPEIYLALASGTIDAAVYSGASDYAGMGLGEVAHYYLVTYITQCTNNIIMNMNTWNSLPDDLKAIVTLAGHEFSIDNRRIYMAGEYPGIQKMGVETVTLSQADILEMGKAAAGLWDEEAALSPRNAQAVEILKEYNRMVGRLQ
jgi:TRAP-type C4-dicarboxylate transport system substrate-binding protein